jgi:uncharacterized protein YjbI with pentapeptide repeats
MNYAGKYIYRSIGIISGLVFILAFLLIILIEIPPLHKQRYKNNFDLNSANLAERTLIEKNATDVENNNRAGIIQVITTFAQIIGGAALFTSLYFTYKTFQATEDGKINERFSKSVEMLGGENLELHLGGIYALERLSRDSQKDYWTTMEVLTAFVRGNSHKSIEAVAVEAEKPVAANDSAENADKDAPDEIYFREDILAALSVIGRREGQALEKDRINLQKASFVNANLSGAKLIGFDLTDANFNKANLNKADLRKATLIRTSLRQADLTDADLTGANLTEADLTEETDLTNAELKDAILNEADLSFADLKDACLIDAKLRNANLTNADLTSANLTNADLTFADLTDADLWGAELNGATLESAIFNEANLEEALLINAVLKKAKFNSADLSNSDFSCADLEEASLNGADLSGADLTYANLTGADLSNADLSGADLSFANLTESNLTNALMKGAKLLGANLSEAKFVTLEQILSATDYNPARLPEELEKELKAKKAKEKTVANRDSAENQPKA